MFKPMFKHARIMLALYAAPLSAAQAQSWSFFGCGSFSCHSATFVKTAIAPVSVYGDVWSYRLDATWQHEFGANGGFFAQGTFSNRTAAYHYPTPTSTSFQLDRLWDAIGWNNAMFCNYDPCFGTVFDGKSGLVRDSWEISTTSVTVFDARGAQYALPFGDPRGPDGLTETGPPVTVQMHLLPEPSSYALMAAGLATLALLHRRRRARTAG